MTGGLFLADFSINEGDWTGVIEMSIFEFEVNFRSTSYNLSAVLPIGF